MGALYHNGDSIGSVPPIDDSSVSDKKLWSSQKTKEEIEQAESYIKRYSVVTGEFSGPLKISHHYFGGTTNTNGDLTVNVNPNFFLDGISLIAGIQCTFRTSGDGTQTVAHFTDTSNQNVQNTAVNLRVHFFENA